MLKLSRLKIKGKILSMLLPLVIGVLFMSATHIKKQWEIKKNGDSLEALVAFAESLSNYIHELQKSRGLGTIYLSSTGKKAGNDLSEQKKKTELQEDAVKKTYANLNQNILTEDMKRNMQEHLKMAENRIDIENKIIKLEIDSEEVKKYYRTSINKQLNLINAISLIANDPSISRNLIAWQNILVAKELSGQERANVAEGIAIGKFEDALYDRIKRMENEQNTYLGLFNNIAEEEQKKIFNDAVTSHVSIAKLESLRKNITRNEKCDINVDDWFDTATDRINQFKEADSALSTLILKNTKQLNVQALNSLYQAIAVSVIIILISIALAILVTKEITTGIRESVNLSKTMAQGDFSKKIAVKSEDELGELSTSFNEMVDNLTQLFSQLKINGDSLASSSEELSAVSSQLLNASSQTKEQSNSVAGATEQMSTNINTMASAVEEMSANTNNVSAASEQMSQNMNAIAGAIEEMSQSIGEIGKNSNNSMKIAGDAMKLSISATETMNILGEAAKEIGQVTSTIKSIAEKTDLLALNATIEAASAGEAGKGFAVVANEIKNLASRSAQAAENIATKISGMQKNSLNAVEVISNVSEIIKKINESIQTITRSVEEQSKASNEIAANISQANSGVRNIASSIGEIAKGASDISKNIGEAAKAANDVSTNISGVNKNATGTTSGAQQVNTSAVDLSKMAGIIKTLLHKFKIKEGA